MHGRGSLIVWAVLFCTVLAVLAERSGLAPLVRAFAAGLVLAKTDRGAHIEERIKPVADPLSPGTLVFALLLTLVAVGSKPGLGVYREDVRRLPVGVGMIPRGEVGLIFAGIGLTGGVITTELYAAVVLIIVSKTVIGPIWLRRLL